MKFELARARSRIASFHSASDVARIIRRNCSPPLKSSSAAARTMLLRDVNNITASLGAWAPELLATWYAEEIWALFEAGELHPDSELTGLFEHDESVADIDSVRHAINDAREEALIDIYRVMRPGAMLVVLEFSRPRSFPFKQVYNFYFRFVLPKIGSLVTKDRSAYTYLPESVQAFPDGEAFETILKKTGFKSTTCKALTFGVSSIYTARK